jgi:hypothetical protein
MVDFRAFAVSARVKEYAQVVIFHGGYLLRNEPREAVG